MVFTIDLQRQLVNMAMKMCSKDVTFPFEHGVHPTILSLLDHAVLQTHILNHKKLLVAQVCSSSFGALGLEPQYKLIWIWIGSFWGANHFKPYSMMEHLPLGAQTADHCPQWHREGLRESRTWKNKSLNVCRLFDIVVAGKVRWQEWFLGLEK